MFCEDSVLKKCELLAPAGDKESFISAVEAGADAIYIGGVFYNARSKGKNFTLEEMKEAVAFAHLRGVKVYVTVNTLYENKDIQDVFAYCQSLYEIGADALIIQDLGLGSMIKQAMPDMELHLSTQGTIYDSSGAVQAGLLGYDRVVLARELSLEEIEKICMEYSGEIEVFVHGAMCISYSGQCQLSRSIGGRSGNKGQCAQCCRLPYEKIENSETYISVEKAEKFEKNNKCKGKYKLSPSDLNLLEYIGDLIEAGVTSLKIEGRLKSPQYVAAVVGMYRKYLDAYYENKSIKVSKEDKRELRQIFNRGNFTTAFFHGKEADDYMSRSLPKNRGVKVGRVNEILHKRGLIKVSLEGEKDDGNSINKPEREDIIEIRDGDEIVKDSFLLTYIDRVDENSYIIGDIKNKVNRGDFVYRVLSKRQQDHYGAFFKNMDWHRGNFNRKCKVNVKVSFTREEEEKLQKNPINVETLRSGNYDNCSLWFNIEVAGFLSGREFAVRDKILLKEKGEPFDIKERLYKSFKKTGDTPFALGDILVEKDTPAGNGADIDVDNFSYKVPMSELNRIRRNLYETLESQVSNSFKRRIEELPLGECSQSLDELKGNKTIAGVLERCTIDEHILEMYYLTLDDFHLDVFSHKVCKWIKDKGFIVRLIFPLVEMERVESSSKVNNLIFDLSRKGVSFGIGYFVGNVYKGEECLNITSHLDKYVNFLREKDTVLYIGNISQLGMFGNKGIKLMADYGINICNDYTAILMMAQKCNGFIRSLECEEENRRMPLMIFEHDFEEGQIEDRKGMRYEFLKRYGTSKTVLRRSKLMNGEEFITIAKELYEKMNDFSERGDAIRSFSGLEIKSMEMQSGEGKWNLMPILRIYM